jgi:hypothetical protein
MTEPEKIKLPSGAELTISKTPFAVSKSLYQAILEEAKTSKIDAATEIDINLYKDLICTAFTSNKIEMCLWGCMKRALYNGEKITESTFEPDEARQDYYPVCIEVAKHNITPFLRGLSHALNPLLAKVKNFQL